MKNFVSYIGKVLKGKATADGSGQIPVVRRQLDLCRFEERIVFSAETQALTFVDTTDLVGASESGDKLFAVVEQDAELHNSSAEPAPQEPLSSAETSAATLAFPGAAGFGAYAKGGRGGDVYHVTNLNDAGLGSLRYGIESMTGPRTIVFDVGGTINLESRLTVSRPYLTIAGQTAPGDGIAIASHTFQIHNTHDIIVRYLRVRAGDQDTANSDAADLSSHDSFAIRSSHDVIVDHVSLSWGIDETLETAFADDVTVQWSIISESLSNSYHPEGVHGLASLSVDGSLSLHHNLYAHHDYRMPQLHGGIIADVVNNVFYDWAKSTPSAVGQFGSTVLNYVNFENNIYVVGPSLESELVANNVFWARDASEVWESGNIVDATVNGVLDFEPADFSRSESSQAVLVDSRFDYPLVPSEDPYLAYESILEWVGASLNRDDVDTRIIQDVINQTGGIIDSQTEIGGLPNLANALARMDTDQDGMPDDWENAFPFLDPLNAEDRNDDFDGDGYTNLEHYLNGIMMPTHPGLILSGELEIISGEVLNLVVTNPASEAVQPDLYAYSLDWNGDSRTDQTVNAPLGTPIQHVFTQAGDYSIQVEVEDPDGQQAAFVHELRVSPPGEEPTDEPQVEPEPVPISLPAKAFVGEAATLTLGTNQDAAGNSTHTYEIDWNGDSHTDQTVNAPAGTAVEHLYHEPGQYEVQVHTLDSQGTSISRAGRTIDIIAPVFSLRFSGPFTTQINQPEAFEIHASNPFHDEPVTIEIDWNGNAQIDEIIAMSPGAHILMHTFQTTGQHSISVFLTHDGERVKTAQHELFVVAPPAEATSAGSDVLTAYDFHVMERFLHASSHEEDDDTVEKV